MNVPTSFLSPSVSSSQGGGRGLCHVIPRLTNKDALALYSTHIRGNLVLLDRGLHQLNYLQRFSSIISYLLLYSVLLNSS